MIPVDISEKYSHQLYFFSEEAINIRLYFSGLLCNTTTTNDHQIEKLYNYDELSQKIAVLTKRSDSYKLINSMLKTENALKIIVALLFKGFSWTNELMNHFNISRKVYVVNTLHCLQKLNLLVKEPGSKLNSYYYETIEKSHNSQTRKVLCQADIYYITKDFVQFCSLLKDLFEYKIKDSESFRFSLKGIMEDSTKFKLFYDRIMDEELNLNVREHKTTDGLIYETETIKSKKFKKELKQASAEFKLENLKIKQNKNLLSTKEKQMLSLAEREGSALVLFDDSEKNDMELFKKVKRGIALYNGEEVNFDKVMEEQRKKDEELEKPPAIIGNPDLAKEEIKTIAGQKIKGFYLSRAAINEFVEIEPEETETDKAELFLESLGGLAR